MALIFFLATWLLLSASLFNMLLLFWLGTTMFLTAERRNWGLWLVLEGMFTGGLFFASHTLILTHELTGFATVDEINFWWKVGWLSIIVAPLIWYIVMLWYSGFWQDKQSPLFRRHWLPLQIMIGFLAALIGLIEFYHPLPAYEEMTVLYLVGSDNIGGVPLVLALYPPYVLLCILLPLDALRHPGPYDRMMGDLARERSRHWLVQTTLLLFGISVLVTVFVIVVVYSAYHRFPFVRSLIFFQMIGAIDLFATLLISLAIVLVGRAVVSYEVFTGKTLPRRGFVRHWRNAILISGGVSTFIGFNILYQPRPIYSLLAMSGIIILLYALLVWRSFAYRDYLIKRLRPFISSQKLVQHLVDPENDLDSQARRMFDMICAEMLNTESACLFPMGVLSPLVGKPLYFPENTLKSPIFLPAGLFSDPDVAVITLDPATHHGYSWAIPLWSARGLIGALLLGNKQDQALYTQEEMDMARAGAERIIDMLAAEQMTRRLMTLQRKRHIEQRVLDRQSRRILHDEILPNVHMAILQVSGLPRTDPAVQSVIALMTDVHSQISNLIHNTSDQIAIVPPEVDLGTAIRRVVEDEFSGEFDRINWQVMMQMPVLDDLTREVVLHAVREVVRNAAIHGRGGNPGNPLTLTLCFEERDDFTIRIVDDGVGLNYSTTTSGSGGGLALHSTMLAIVGGDLLVEPGEKRGTQVIIRLPRKEVMRAESL